MLVKEILHMRAHTVWFHLYQIVEQAKIIHDGEKIRTVIPEEVRAEIIWKGAWGKSSGGMVMSHMS